MSHFMEEKIKKVEEYIDELDNAIDKNEVERAKELQTEIIAVYEPEIESLKSELDNYSITQFDTSTS